MKYDHINFKPPETVARAAEKGLEYRSKQTDKAGLTPEEASREGIGSGVQRAVNLKNRTNISPEVIRQMVAFFSRHEKNKAIDPKYKNEPWKDKGYVSHLLWGGDPGKAWAEKIKKQMETADSEKTAKRAPSEHHLTDEYEPTNPTLWERVKEVARGDKQSYSSGGTTIHRPSNWFRWPSPHGSAWAVKQYNNFGGGWTKKKPEGQKEAAALRIFLAGGIVTTSTQEEEQPMQRLASLGFAVRSGTSRGCSLWEGSPRLIKAALGEDLKRKIQGLLHGPYDWLEARKVGEWLDANFRISSPKTPPKGKQLKTKAQTLIWVLRNRVVAGTAMGMTPEETFEKSYPDPAKKKQVLDYAQDEVRRLWSDIEPQLAFLVSAFTDEGSTVVPKELAVGGTTYINAAGIKEDTLKKYVSRLEAIINSLHGWRSKAAKSGLKVVLASPKDFRGTSGGKYKESEDALYVRATPDVLKRGGGSYGSFEYILVHELEHRYDKHYATGVDFDRPEWWTTKYSRKEGFGLSEAFAELFAIGHFGMQGPWDQKVVDRFEALMQGKKDDEARPPTPEHIRKLLEKRPT